MRISDWSSDVCSSDLVDELERRQLGCGDDGVVGQVGRDGVAVLVEADLFEERLSGTLGDATMALALGQQRVEDATRVVHGDVAPQHDPPGLGVDVDHRAVGAEVVGGRLGGAVHGRGEEHTSELQSLMRISYAVFCLKKK